jgi:hypothetical protein
MDIFLWSVWKKSLVYLSTLRISCCITVVHSCWSESSAASSLAVPKYLFTCRHVLRFIPLRYLLYVVLLVDRIHFGQEKNLCEGVTCWMSNKEHRTAEWRSIDFNIHHSLFIIHHWLLISTEPKSHRTAEWRFIDFNIHHSLFIIRYSLERHNSVLVI